MYVENLQWGNEMTKRYKEYWINEMEKPKTYFFSEKEVQEYVRQFPIETPVLMDYVELDCIGHTYRQILGYDELDCGVKHDFLEHPHRYFVRSLLLDLVDWFQSFFHRKSKSD